MDKGNTGVVRETSINVRRPGPGQAPKDGQVVGVLALGAMVSVVDDFGDGWPFVQAGSGASAVAGYIDQSNVSWGKQDAPPRAPLNTGGSDTNRQGLQPNASAALRDLVDIYAAADVAHPNLKPITLAQWIVESGWGTSDLATKYNNFGGLKFREEMSNIASKVSYRASDGIDIYCSFKTKQDFISGYWKFINRQPYNGWTDHTASPEDFINFIGPRYTPTRGYAQSVLKNLGAAEGLLDDAKPVSSHAIEHGDGNPVAKPIVEVLNPPSPFQGSRNGAKIDHIVIHYTTSRNLAGTIATFTNNNTTPPRSAHYAVGRDGRIVQFVADSRNAWHAGKKDMNKRSIGIEHSAAAGDQITPEQENASLQLIRWLVHEYDIPLKNIVPHDFVHPTSCPGQLLSAYSDEHSEAVRLWIERNL